MAEKTKRAIEYHLDRIENELQYLKEVAESTWETRPLKSVAKRNMGLFEFALDIFEKMGYNTFNSTEAYDFYQNCRRGYGTSHGWNFTLFKCGILERKRTVGKNINKKIFDYRFRKEGIELVKEKLKKV